MYSVKPPGFRCTICRKVYDLEAAAERCQRSGDPGVRLEDAVVPKGDPTRRGSVVGFAEGHKNVRVRFPDEDGIHHSEQLFLSTEVMKPQKAVPAPRGVLSDFLRSRRPPSR